MKAVIPLCRRSRSTVANTIARSASVPLVMKILLPFRTYSSPSRTAVVRIAAGSLPASGSVSAKQPSIWPRASGLKYSSFCASVPNLRIGSQTSELLTDRITPLLAQTPAYLLDDEAVRKRVHAGTTVLLWDRHPSQSELPGLGEKLTGELAGLVDLLGPRSHDLVRELPNRVLQ